MTDSDVWVKFAAAALTGLLASHERDDVEGDAALCADDLLIEWQERFPKSGATTGAAQPQE